MASTEPELDAVRDRLSRQLSDWGGEVSSLLVELGRQRDRVAELEAAAAQGAGELEALRRDARDREALIEQLTPASEEATVLKGDLRQKALEVERLAKALEQEQELVAAWRKKAEQVDGLQAALQRKEHDLEQSLEERAALTARMDEVSVKLSDLEADFERRDGTENAELMGLRAELTDARDALDVTRGELDATRAELDATRAEVEARKALIKSLRADADKAAVLEGMLEEKSQIIRRLEQSMDRAEQTIQQPRAALAAGATDPDGEDTTIAARVDPPAFSEAELAEIQDSEDAPAGEDADVVDTISIDMRGTLEKVRNRAKVE